MALIEEFIVVAHAWPVAAGQSIIEGQLVKLDVNGNVNIANGGAGEVCVGIAGDTKSTTTSGLADTNNAWIGASSTQQQFVAHVQDNFDETKASGKITVYHSGGAFFTNQYETASYAVGNPLYVSVNGNFTNVASTSGQIVAYCTAVPSPYESGVPGTDVNGSISLGNFMEIKLQV